MVIEQRKWTNTDGWKIISNNQLENKAQLVLVFGSTALVKNRAYYKEIAAWYPKANIITCSTAGEIIESNVSDNTLVVTAIAFKSSKVECRKTKIIKADQSHDVGAKLAKELPQKGLVHVMIFSEGLTINGTKLVAGLQEALPKEVSVTGGLVGDSDKFKETATGLNEPASSGTIVAVGFYGSKLRVGYGSLGGWDPFGVERTITKATDNILYELDNKPALELYKTYLGEKAKDLPSSALLFPLSLRLPNSGEQVVRTILSVDEAKQSMTFAGDMPVGAFATLMKANFERLIDGAANAASSSIQAVGSKNAELAILISCIGRKLLLKERTEEEVEAVRKTIGPQAAVTGFYSYGELCPTAATEKQCKLHNQTMTITTLSEE